MRKKGKIHAAKLLNSDRLMRVDAFLQDGVERSTRAIIRACHVCAVNSIVAELRVANRVIACRRSGDRWLYRMGA
jgi:hypothetical protein